MPTVTPVPLAPAKWKVAATGDSEPQVRTASYEANVDFSFADIFTGEVRQVLFCAFQNVEEMNRLSVDQHFGSDIALLCYVALFVIQTACCDWCSKIMGFCFDFCLILCKKIV